MNAPASRGRSGIVKTTITITVLHRDDNAMTDHDIEEVLYEMRDGEAVGWETGRVTEPVPAEKVYDELVALGNDGEFFDDDFFDDDDDGGGEQGQPTDRHRRPPENGTGPIKVVVLNDGETYSDLTGCVVLELPDGLPDVDVDEFVQENYVHGIPVGDVPVSAANNPAADTLPAPWEDDPDYPMADWRYEVRNGDELRGYREWVAHRRELDLE